MINLPLSSRLLRRKKRNLELKISSETSVNLYRTTGFVSQSTSMFLRTAVRISYLAICQILFERSYIRFYKIIFSSIKIANERSIYYSTKERSIMCNCVLKRLSYSLLKLISPPCLRRRKRLE